MRYVLVNYIILMYGLKPIIYYRDDRYHKNKKKNSALAVISVLDTKEMMPLILKPIVNSDSLLLCALAVTSIRVMVF